MTQKTKKEIMDERYIAVDVLGKGLVIFSACSHAGIVNIIRDAIAKFSRPIHMVRSFIIIIIFKFFFWAFFLCVPVEAVNENNCCARLSAGCTWLQLTWRLASYRLLNSSLDDSYRRLHSCCLFTVRDSQPRLLSRKRLGRGAFQLG